MYKFVLFIMCLLTVQNVFADNDQQSTLPIESFATLPFVSQVDVSDDGKQVALVRGTSANGDYIIEIRKVADLKAKPIRLGAQKMEITGFSWLNNTKLLIDFRQNIQDGNDNYWVSKSAIVNANGKGKWLVPFPKDNAANFSLLSLLATDPDHILLEYDINDNGIPDVIKFNINSGKTKTILRGNEKVSFGFVADSEGNIRAATGYDAASNSIKYYARLKNDETWREIFANSPNHREKWEFLYFSIENPNEIYVNANLGENTTGIYTYNIKTGEYSDRLFGLKSVDANSVILSSKEENRGQLVGFSYFSKHPKRHFTDASEQALYQGISDLFPGKYVSISSRSHDDNEIIIYTRSDIDSGSFYLMTDKNKLEFLGAEYPLIKPEHLSSVKYIKYKARDGRIIPAYVTLPKGKKPYPTVVMPHGGPWSRDVNIYDEWAQLLAHNGYAVIQPQFRGSDGFGMEHWKAGDKEWGLKMQDDNDDAALYLVEKGIADENKLALFGWSYGGYAAFVASMREDNIYQCTVAGAGVSDINRVGASIFENRFIRILQGPTVKGISPIDHVEKVNIPILVVHGDIDQRVPVEHSRLFVDKLKKLEKKHRYIELKGADHFSNTLYYEHKVEFYSALIQWLNTEC